MTFNLTQLKNNKNKIEKLVKNDSVFVQTRSRLITSSEVWTIIGNIRVQVEQFCNGVLISYKA